MSIENFRGAIRNGDIPLVMSTARDCGIRRRSGVLHAALAEAYLHRAEANIQALTQSSEQANARLRDLAYTAMYPNNPIIDSNPTSEAGYFFKNVGTGLKGIGQLSLAFGNGILAAVQGGFGQLKNLETRQFLPSDTTLRRV